MEGLEASEYKDKFQKITKGRMINCIMWVYVMLFFLDGCVFNW